MQQSKGVRSLNAHRMEVANGKILIVFNLVIF